MTVMTMMTAGAAWHELRGLLLRRYRLQSDGNHRRRRLQGGASSSPPPPPLASPPPLPWREQVIDGIGKSTVDISIDCLSRRGIFVSFGNASGAVPPFPVLRLIKKSAFVTRPKLLDYVADREELLMRSSEVRSHWRGREGGREEEG